MGGIWACHKQILLAGPWHSHRPASAVPSPSPGGPVARPPAAPAVQPHGPGGPPVLSNWPWRCGCPITRPGGLVAWPWWSCRPAPAVLSPGRSDLVPSRPAPAVPSLGRGGAAVLSPGPGGPLARPWRSCRPALAVPSPPLRRSCAPTPWSDGIRPQSRVSGGGPSLNGE